MEIGKLTPVDPRAVWLHEQLNRHVAALRDVLSNDPGAPAAGGVL